MYLKPPFSINYYLHQSFQHNNNILNFKSYIHQYSIPNTLNTISNYYLPHINLQQQFQHISIYTNQQNIHNLHKYNLPTKTHTI